MRSGALAISSRTIRSCTWLAIISTCRLPNPRVARSGWWKRPAPKAAPISAVQVTRENLLPLYGTVGGQPVSGKPGLYRIDTVVEKPTPTEAEQRLVVPGLRSGQYLCFFGMHVLTPADLRHSLVDAGGSRQRDG